MLTFKKANKKANKNKKLISLLHPDFTYQIYLTVSFFGFVTLMGHTSSSLLMYTKVNEKLEHLKFSLKLNHSEGYVGIFVS